MIGEETHSFPAEYAGEVQQSPRLVQYHRFRASAPVLVVLLAENLDFVDDRPVRIRFLPSSLQHQQSHQMTNRHSCRTLEIPRASNLDRLLVFRLIGIVRSVS